jgi:hypothetical protein
MFDALLRGTTSLVAQGWFSSKLLLWTNDNVMNGHLEIPIRARVVHGWLDCDLRAGCNNTFKAAVGETPITHTLSIVNRFTVPVVMYSAKIPDRNFEVTPQPKASLGYTSRLFLCPQRALCFAGA